MLKVFCNYNGLEGECTKQDFEFARTGINPSGMVKVIFKDFTQAVPFHTIIEI